MIATCLEYQQTQPQEKTMPYEIPNKLWEVIGTGTFFVKIHLCIIDCYSMFPNVNKANSLAADDMAETAKIIVTDFELPKKFFQMQA